MKKYETNSLYATSDDVVFNNTKQVVAVKTYSLLNNGYHNTYVSFRLPGESEDSAILRTIDQGIKVSSLLDFLSNI